MIAVIFPTASPFLGPADGRKVRMPATIIQRYLCSEPSCVVNPRQLEKRPHRKRGLSRGRRSRAPPATWSPVARKWTFTKRSGRHLDYERLILPLAPDDHTVNMSLTGAEGFGFG